MPPVDDPSNSKLSRSPLHNLKQNVHLLIKCKCIRICIANPQLLTRIDLVRLLISDNVKSRIENIKNETKREFSGMEFPIKTQREIICQLSELMEEDDSIYTSDEYARRRGFEAAVVPPSIILSLLSLKLRDAFLKYMQKLMGWGRRD